MPQKISARESAQTSLPKKARSHTKKSSVRAQNVTAIYEHLEIMYPDAHCELNYENAFQLLVATVLSAQTTDIRVNSVTGLLFAHYGTPELLAQAQIDDIASIIKSIGFYRVKAQAIITLSQQILELYSGEVPSDLSDLTKLRGVGRKTAHVVRGNAFGLPGLTIDTHCGRLARRFGWTVQQDPVKVESDLARIIPEKWWTQLCHLMIFHGRRICHSRTPACGSCYLAQLCPSFGTGPTEPGLSQALVKGVEREHLLTLVGQEKYVHNI